jgi:ribosomal protein S25
VQSETRRLSAALFNNDKVVEVVLELERLRSEDVTTAKVASATSINHDLAGKVLRRLAGAGVLKELPRVAGPRSALPYRVQAGPAWAALVELCSLLQADSGRR